VSSVFLGFFFAFGSFAPGGCSQFFWFHRIKWRMIMLDWASQAVKNVRIGDLVVAIFDRKLINCGE